MATVVTEEPVIAAATPAVETPAVQTPAVETPAVTTPATTTPNTQPEPGTKEAPRTEPPTPPEKYELRLPDGADTWLDQADVTHIEALAKTHGWTNEQAQSALEEHVDVMKAQSQAFRTATEADPIYGGDHLEQTQTLARRALDRVRPAGTARGDALRTLLTKSGYGNHLEVVSLLADLGKLMAEDQPAGGGSAAVTPQAPEHILYPTMK